VYLTGVHLTGVHLMGLHLMGVYLITLFWGCTVTGDIAGSCLQGCGQCGSAALPDGVIKVFVHFLLDLGVAILWAYILKLTPGPLYEIEI